MFMKGTNLFFYLVGASSFLISLCLTPFVRKLAIRFNIMDHPSSHIKSHRQATPYLGGLAIALGIVGGLGTALVIPSFMGFSGWVVFLLPLLALFALGTLDDIYNYSARLRFFIQSVIFLILMMFTGLKIPITGWPIFDFFFTLVWLVGITNAFNIIDIMDGLSAGVTIMISVFLAILAMQKNVALVALFAFMIAGSTSGFIGFNFSKTKKIFMGDGGSTLLGGLLGIAAVIFCQVSVSEHLLVDFISLLILFGIPIYDTFLVMILRLKNGDSPFKGSRDHFALRMVQMGFSSTATVISAYVVTLALGLISFVIFHFNDHLHSFLLLSAVLLLGITWGRMLSIINVRG